MAPICSLERGRVGRRVAVDDAQHRHLLSGGMAKGELDELGRLGAAGRAPAGEEIEQHPTAAEVCQRRDAAVKIAARRPAGPACRSGSSRRSVSPRAGSRARRRARGRRDRPRTQPSARSSSGRDDQRRQVASARCCGRGCQGGRPCQPGPARQPGPPRPSGQPRPSGRPRSSVRTRVPALTAVPAPSGPVPAPTGTSTRGMPDMVSWSGRDSPNSSSGSRPRPGPGPGADARESRQARAPKAVMAPPTQSHSTMGWMTTSIGRRPDREDRRWRA